MTAVSTFPTANQAAFCTITVLAASTAACVFVAATTASTVALVAFSILAITGVAFSTASITAWISTEENTANAYFKTLPQHVGYALAGTYYFVTQVLVQAVVAGIGDAIRFSIFRRVTS